MTVGETSDLAAGRARMVETIAAEVRETAYWLGKEALDEAVMAAMGRVPRHRFIPPANQDRAYDNRPQPIGHGQTISQPYIVAVMADLARVKPGDKVLEVGSGCGYQSAILAELGARVYAIEVIPELATPSHQRLAELGYDSVQIRLGDGTRGWPEAAPFDAIVVSAAAWHRVPPALLEQLAPGGRLVIPIERGSPSGRYPFFGQDQHLVLVEKSTAGRISEKEVLLVSFVPLVEQDRGGRHGKDRQP